MLTRFVTSRAADRDGLLTPAALECGRVAIRDFVDAALEWGFDPIDVPDAFYTFERVTRWAGANSRKVPWSVLYAPLATTTFASVAFSLPAIVRYSEPLHWKLLRHLAPDLHAYPVADGGWRTQVPYANLAQQAYRRARRQTIRADLRPIRLEWLESLRHDLATQCVDRSESPLWDVVDRTAFASVMLDDEAGPARRQSVETLFGIVTLFEYEELRSASPLRTAARG